MSATEPKDLNRFTGPTESWNDQFETRSRARDQVLSIVLEAVWNAPSLGSPYVFERDGALQFRAGWFVAPLEGVLTTNRGLGDLLRLGFEERAGRWLEEHEGMDLPRPAFQDSVEFTIAARGFIDLRPTATLVCSLDESATLSEIVTVCKSEEDFEGALAALQPYDVFTSSGLLAILHRLRAIGEATRTTSVELGTHQDWVWHIPRDTSHHALVVPGIVEALRVSSEGLEKTTGTEWLDGMWGYAPRQPADRRGVVGGPREPGSAVNPGESILTF